MIVSQSEGNGAFGSGRRLEFDVVVIGASSAGLHAAELLAREGKRVGLFERREELSPDRRTLIVTAELRKLLGEVPPGAMLHRIDWMILASPESTRRIRFQEADPIVERSELARWLSSRVKASGGGLYFGCRFHGFRETNGALEIRFQNSNSEGLVKARQAVIGADGVFSDVARAAGISRPPTVPIVQAEVALPQGWEPSATQVWFDADETRFFYWLIPESSVRAVVGLVGDRGVQTRGLLKRFLLRHKLKPEAYQAARVAMHHPRLTPWGKVGKTPVYLVGDAAGQVKVTTVGGTVTGLLGAQAAVRSILNGTPFRRELRPLKRELDLHWIIRSMLDRLDNWGYEMLLNTLSPRLHYFLSQHNRDSMAPVLWRLPFLEPRLLRVALCCLRGRSAKNKRLQRRGVPTLDYRGIESPENL